MHEEVQGMFFEKVMFANWSFFYISISIFLYFDRFAGAGRTRQSKESSTSDEIILVCS